MRSDRLEGEEKQVEPVQIEGFSVVVDPEEVRRLLGYRDEGIEGTEERVARAIEESIGIGSGLIEPKGIYTVTAGGSLPGSRMFEDLERVAFCICTIGPGVEREVSALTGRGEILRALVLDSVGSVAAEAVAEHIDGEIQALASLEGLKTSCRSSPGYGDWDIREQACIFSLLPGERVGVTLSESFMMIPRKSITFAIHIAEKPARMRSKESCRNCDILDCPYRLLE
jgi:hypothetical protein